MVNEAIARNKRNARIYKGVGLFVIFFILILMYVPILVLIAFSFTTATNVGTWTGFSFDLYSALFKDEEIMTALGNTIILALSSSLVSVVLGTAGAIGTFYSKKKARAAIELVNQIPVVNAEIVIAMSLTVMFVFCGTYLFMGASIFSFWTLLIGHVVLSLPFVYLSIKPKLLQMDPHIYEAALDLGCGPWKAIGKAVLPEIMPGIGSGFLLAITLSLDDFIVTAFTRGAGLLSGEKTIDTLSTLVQAKIKKGPVPPEMRALTTLIFVLVLLIVIGITVYQNLKARKAVKKRRG
ncbi:MAG: ABC transporter permease [Firmicutes bacterium]|uniref:ABC transporter permease n=1 Tax=Candidatus Alloenteromonas pullistercoris TaxID=2840785 RepID=A0A9D9DH78_9FIRM|nr:ABC transporter permease [Candidatus Enteromonas pullistercoris]